MNKYQECDCSEMHKVQEVRDERGNFVKVKQKTRIPQMFTVIDAMK